MITANSLSGQPIGWKQAWRDAVTDPRELLALLDLNHLIDALPAAAIGFPMRVPHAFIARMRRGDPHDPLLLQVLPVAAEMIETAGFKDDAVGDNAARVTDGVLQKYSGRALLITTGACAVHCRYCFRRHFPYAQESAAKNAWARAVEQVRNDPRIEEVILSGGDPLSLSTAKLAELSAPLGSLRHVKRLRIHTRLPIVLPARIDQELTRWLARLPWPIAIVLHANHANELDNNVAEACTRLRATGATLLNQSVLLRDVNDNVDALAALSERLFACGVLPYYLHQLDRVRGTAHFEVDDDRARSLVAALRARLSGYLVPQLVREEPGMPNKTPL